MMEVTPGTSGSTDTERLHEDIARIKAALQSEEDDFSGGESEGSEDDGLQVDEGKRLVPLI